MLMSVSETIMLANWYRLNDGGSAFGNGTAVLYKGTAITQTKLVIRKIELAIRSLFWP